MIDIPKQITYWRDGAQEDLVVAEELMVHGRIRHGLFFAQLALEKLLKAHVCQHKGDIAPRIHNLVRLAELAEIPLEQEQVYVLAEMNSFNIEGRYPESLTPPPTLEEARSYLTRAKEVFEWLMNRL